MSGTPTSTPNLLLNAMPEAVRARLLPRMTRIDLHRELVLIEQGVEPDAAFFIEQGIVSIVSTNDRVRTEIGIVGKEGLIGASGLLGERRARFESFVQVDGGTALRIGMDDLRAEMDSDGDARRFLLAFVQTLLVQVSLALVSAAQHMMEARLARWLLMCHDRVVGDQIPLTHEFMAVMISAQRSGVTITLHSLEGAGMIRSTRGLVTILDRAKLEDLAGGSYGQPEAEYREMIAPFGKSEAP